MHNLAITLSHQGDINRARGLEERALELSRRIHGEEHPDTSNYEWNLLTTLVKLGEQSAQREFLKNLRGF
jgi:Tetratricopeptide repeat